MKKNAQALETNSNTDNEILLHHVGCLLILGSIFPRFTNIMLCLLNLLLSCIEVFANVFPCFESRRKTKVILIFVFA